MQLRCAWFSFLIVGFFLISDGAQACNIHIDDTNPDGSITISWANFDFGFSVNGGPRSINGSVTLTPTLTSPQVSFSGSWITSGGSGGGTTLYFVDPGTNHVRDSLSVSSDIGASTAFISGSFSSDVPT